MDISLRALVKNSMLYLSAFFWLCVLYFSLCEDEKAAVLSYVSLALAVLMIKYGIFEKCICASVVDLIGIISKVLIIGGILLAIFSQFWNTAFYSVCLGILMLKMKWEIESSNACSNINMTMLNDTKDEFKPIIPQKLPVQLQKATKEEQMEEENKINDIGEIDKNALFRITPEPQNKANEIEKTWGKASSLKNYWNRSPLNFPEIVSNYASVNKNLLKQSNKNNLSKNDESTKAQSNNFIKRDELTIVKHNKKIFESIYDIKGSSLLKTQDPLEFPLTEVDQSNIKLELKQTEERNCKFPEKPTTPNDATQKKNIFRDDILKQLDIIADMLENINWQKNEMRKELANAQDSINSHVEQDAMKNFSRSNLFQPNLDNVKDKFHQKCVRSFDDEVNLLIFNKSINLDIDDRLQKSSKIVKGTNTEIDPESLANKIGFQRENCSETDKTSKPETKHMRLTSVKSTDIQHANEKCSSPLNGMSEQIAENVNLKRISTNNDLEIFPVSEKSLQSGVLNNSMNVDIEREMSNRNELDTSAEKENGTDEHVRKTSKNVDVAHSPTVNDVEGVVNRIDLRFIYAVGF